MMKVLAISDLHGYLPHITDCDLLLLAGDYEPTRNIEQAKRFFQGPFTDWLKKVPARHIVGVAGNHDFALKDKEFAKSLPWIYLQDELLTLEGVRIYGTPWTPQFYDWAFMGSEKELEQKFAAIPEKLDILLSHGPAHRMLDRNAQGVCCGSISLRDRVAAVKPDSVVCGHIHEGRGIREEAPTRYYNVTYVNVNYEPKFNPMSIELRAG